MKLIQFVGFLTFASISLVGCASSVKVNETETLYKYAHANCIFWYFKEKGYNTDDIRLISGGMVETSSISIEKFQNIALFIKDYEPQIDTKNNIDSKLNRCFVLESSAELKNIIND